MSANKKALKHMIKKQKEEAKKAEPVTKQVWDIKTKADYDVIENAQKPYQAIISDFSKLQGVAISQEKRPTTFQSFKNNFYGKSYAFNYDPKRHKLSYNDGFDHKMCHLVDKSWGNLISALNSITTWEFSQENEEAKRILDIDTYHYIRMHSMAVFAANYFKEQEQKFEAKQKENENSDIQDKNDKLNEQKDQVGQE